MFFLPLFVAFGGPGCFRRVLVQRFQVRGDARSLDQFQGFSQRYGGTRFF